MYKTFKYIFILFFLQLTYTVVAQNYTLSYRVLDSEDGLLNSRVNSFLYDSNGFMWISTEEGIARYDGHQFQWFSEVNSKLRGVPKSKILVEDDEGYIWVTYIDKIDLIHTKTLEIIPLEEKIKSELPFKGEIFRIRPARNHHVFINQRGKWYQYHSSTGIIELPELEKVFNIQPGIGDRIWLYRGAYKLMGSYHLKSKKITPLPFFASNNVLPIFDYTEKELFWVLTPYTLSIFEFKNETFNKIVEFTSEYKHEARTATCKLYTKAEYTSY